MDNTIKVAQESMNQGEKIVDLLEQFGLFWNVKKVPLLTADGDATGFFGIQREDSRKVFTTTKDSYQVLQNWELAEMIVDVAGSFDMEVARGGMFNEGGRVYLQIGTGDLKGIGQNNDTVKKYITAMNSHDGSSSVGFGMTNVTVSCSNTFHRAYKDLGSKIRHTMSMKDRIEQLKREFERVQHAEKNLYEKFFKMAEREASVEDIKKVVSMVTSVSLDTKEDEAKTLYSAFQLKAAQQLTGRISEEMTIKGQTLWGLFSGVTKYTNRDIRTPKRDNATLESKFLGGAGKTDNKVYMELTKQFV